MKTTAQRNWARHDGLGIQGLGGTGHWRTPYLELSALWEEHIPSELKGRLIWREGLESVPGPPALHSPALP